MPEARSSASPPKAQTMQTPTTIATPRIVITQLASGRVPRLGAAQIAAVSIGSMIAVSITKSFQCQPTATVQGNPLRIFYGDLALQLRL
jgi:hypothetical protein